MARRLFLAQARTFVAVYVFLIGSARLCVFVDND